MCLAALLLSQACFRGQFQKTSKIEGAQVCDLEADDAMGRKEYETAILLHRRFLDKEPNNALALYHLGYSFGQIGDHVTEIFFYEQAVSHGFEAPDIFFNLGMAYGELNEVDKSIDAFHRSLQVDPSDADSHYGLAMAYRQKSADKLAEKHFLKALESNPSHVDARLHLAVLYMDRHEDDKAVQQIHRLLEIDPTHEEACRLLQIMKKASGKSRL